MCEVKKTHRQKRMSVWVDKYRYDIHIYNGFVSRIEKCERVFLSGVTKDVAKTILKRIEKAGYTTEIDDHGIILVTEVEK